MERHLDIICEKLDLKNDWEERKSAMAELETLVFRENLDPSQFSIQLKPIINQLEIQLSDRRSIIVKEVCCLISTLAKKLETWFEQHTEALITGLLKLVVVTVLIIAESSDNCIRDLLKYCRGARAIPKLISLSLHDKSPIVRSRCSEYALLILLEWGSSHEVQRNMELYHDLIKGCVTDAVPEVRSTGRKCFYAFQEHWPQRAAKLFSSLEHQTQKLIKDDEGMKSDSKEVKPKSAGRPAFARISSNSSDAVRSVREAAMKPLPLKPVQNFPLLRAVRTAGALNGAAIVERREPAVADRENVPVSLVFKAADVAQQRESRRKRISVGVATRVHVAAAEKPAREAAPEEQKLTLHAKHVSHGKTCFVDISAMNAATKAGPVQTTETETGGEKSVIRRLDFIDFEEPAREHDFQAMGYFGEQQRAAESRAVKAGKKPLFGGPKRVLTLPKVPENGPEPSLKQDSPPAAELTHIVAASHAALGSGSLAGLEQALFEEARAVGKAMAAMAEEQTSHKPVLGAEEDRKQSRVYLRKRSSLAGTFSSKASLAKEASRKVQASPKKRSKKAAPALEEAEDNVKEALVKGLSAATDWTHRLAAMAAYRKLLEKSPEEGRDVVMQDAATVLKLLGTFVENTHAKVAVEAMAAASLTVEICRPPPLQLALLLPPALCQLAVCGDHRVLREASRKLLTVVATSLAAGGDQAVADLLLPAVAKSLDRHKGEKARLAILSSVSALLRAGATADSPNLLPIGSVPRVWVARLCTLFLTEKSLSVKTAALDSLLFTLTSLDRQAVLSHLQSRPPSEEKELRKALLRRDPAISFAAVEQVPGDSAVDLQGEGEAPEKLPAEELPAGEGSGQESVPAQEQESAESATCFDSEAGGSFQEEAHAERGVGAEQLVDGQAVPEVSPGVSRSTEVNTGAAAAQSEGGSSREQSCAEERALIEFSPALAAAAAPKSVLSLSDFLHLSPVAPVPGGGHTQKSVSSAADRLQQAGASAYLDLLTGSPLQPTVADKAECGMKPLIDISF